MCILNPLLSLPPLSFALFSLSFGQCYPSFHASPFSLLYLSLSVPQTMSLSILYFFLCPTLISLSSSLPSQTLLLSLCIFFLFISSLSPPLSYLSISFPSALALCLSGQWRSFCSSGYQAAIKASLSDSRAQPQSRMHVNALSVHHSKYLFLALDWKYSRYVIYLN